MAGSVHRRRHRHGCHWQTAEEVQRYEDWRCQVKVYQFMRNDRHECVLYVIERGERPRALPMVISSDQVVRSPILTAVTAMLLDYFSSEDGAETKAACLARLVANKLARAL